LDRRLSFAAMAFRIMGRLRHRRRKFDRYA
jgi:hypothetical protein